MQCDIRLISQFLKFGAYPKPDHILPDAGCLAVIHSHLKYNTATLSQQCTVHLQIPTGYRLSAQSDHANIAQIRLQLWW